MNQSSAIIPDSRPIFLIGYMGCGKSTLGRALGKYTDREFIDLDNYIETRYHANVREIFARFGEERFRDMESRMLAEVAQFENVIVACGGGTPCFHSNMDLINASGHSVWLQASEPVLLHRLVRGRNKRPLLAGKTDEQILLTIRAGLKERERFYSRARHTFCSDLLETREEIIDATNSFIQQFLTPKI